MKSRIVTATDLLHGAMYAMEQAGRLLHDGNLLYRQGRYSSAVALAVFCREELGRAKILLENRKRVLAGEQVSLVSLRTQCDDHVEKLRRGQTGFIIRWAAEQSDKIKGLFSHPQSSESREAHRVAEEIAKQRKQRDPHDMHQMRIRALYVEPSETGGWNRPCDISQEEARRLLEDVANDYALRTNPVQLQIKDPELAAAIAQCHDRPPLPDPVWPNG